MKTITTKAKLQAYIDQADDRLVKMLFAVAKEYMEDYENIELSEDDLKLLEERRNNRLSGKSKTYNWDDVKLKIIGGERAA